MSFLEVNSYLCHSISTSHSCIKTHLKCAISVTVLSTTSRLHYPQTFLTPDHPPGMKERADIPWAVYRGLMRSQMRIGSPTDSPHWSRPALSLQTQYTQSRLLSEIPHREPSLGGRCRCHSRCRKKPTKCFICWSACRFFWNSIHVALSIHLLLHFFQVCFTWKWKFWLGATEPDKSPSAKKKKKERRRRNQLNCTGPEKKCPPLSSLCKLRLRRNL